ncbi:uncharacterized protein LOC135712305 [Ochlerotatus camptorhynchus]|uniref:uncharacterized protein LOC135712305 n=1 Tax=Ochlerotatus camptorhynchus TaxID=644619 RepID=UPI0031CDB639
MTSTAVSESASTTASAREAKLRLDMQRLAEEKEVRARLLAEKECQDKDMQERAMRLEKERRDKAITDLMVLEKEFIDKKYQLLQARLEEDEDGKSSGISHSSALPSGMSRGGYNLPSQHYPGISVSSYQAPILSVSQQPSIPVQHPFGPNSQQLAARHVVPKELPSFSGNPAEWPLFWSSFDTSTQMCGYTDAENLMRLQRSLKGDARKSVSCFLLHPANVAEVMNTLHSLYGRPDTIIQTLLNEVRATPTPKPEKLETLINFGLAELVEKLPANIKLDWALHKQRVLVADLRAFAEYMNVLVTAASSVTAIGESSSQKADRLKGNMKAGSDSTLVENSIARQLGIVGQPAPLCMQWTNGVKRMEEASQRVELYISASDSTKRFALNGVHTVKSLDLPRQSLRFEDFERDFPHLRGLPVKSYNDASPGILIGLDNTKIKTTLKLKEGKSDEPVAAKTRIGWVVFGRNRGPNEGTSRRIIHMCSQPCDQLLHDLVKDFFRVEGAGVSSPNALDSADDRRARRILEATTVRTPSGRFQTGLLWKYDQVEFPNSRLMAERRLHCLEKRLLKSPELYSEVKQQIVAYQAKGYAHIATDMELAETDPKQVWYLPLGVVVNPKKSGKVRVVWDAASKVQGVSLNSVLLKGPDLLTPLPAVLSRYRQRQVAISGDIREAFHQILIRPEDRRAQWFLWRDDPSLPIQILVMDVATFGSSCSPCSLQFVKNLNADELAEEFPKAAEAVKENHYVDDYLDSVDTVDEAVQLVDEVRTIHAKGGFEIRHWLSNSSDVIDRIGACSEGISKCFVMDKCSSTERVLGMAWQPTEDVFSFSIQLRENLQPLMTGDTIPTKREALSLVMSVFDPLGLLAVVLVHGKVLLQDIWRAGVDWDEFIPADTFGRWKTWIQILRQLNEVKIPRCYFPGYGPQAYDSLELHIFVDASEAAYAACAYFRVLDHGIVRCCLVSAKTKVAPLKPLSIPRLELQAAVMGARLLKTVISNHTLKIHRKILWSDSTTVLSWLGSDPRRRTQFVAFRVGEILETTDIKDWRWVPTKCNVADDATKWGIGPNIEANSRWFKGPGFLYENEDYWPQRELPLADSPLELRPTNVQIHVEVEQVIDFKRFSKWERLLRTIAFVGRFYKNCLSKTRNEPTCSTSTLNREELRHAEFTVWRLVKLNAYPEEFTMLLRNQKKRPDHQQTIKKSSRLYGKSPVIGEGGLIRMERRMGEADWISDDVKFPVILPKANYVTFLLADWYHRTYRHANGETVVNEIVQKYSISALRVLVRNVSTHCNWCRVYKTKPQTPRMGPLPAVRLTPYVRPFSFVGLDYFGPITVRIGRSNAKRWIALFTCLSVRAIHLEVASSLSTESCKMAIRRLGLLC